MGLFLRITYQSQGGRTPETAFKNQRILAEIIDGLNDFDWQESNSTKLTTLDPQYSHIAINPILRFFLSANNMIEKIMYLYRKYRDEIIFGKLLENLLDMKKPPKKSVVFILRRGRDSNSWCELPRTPV